MLLLSVINLEYLEVNNSLLRVISILLQLPLLALMHTLVLELVSLIWTMFSVLELKTILSTVPTCQLIIVPTLKMLV